MTIELRIETRSVWRLLKLHVEWTESAFAASLSLALLRVVFRIAAVDGDVARSPR